MTTEISLWNTRSSDYECTNTLTLPPKTTRLAEVSQILGTFLLNKLSTPFVNKNIMLLLNPGARLIMILIQNSHSHSK